MSTTTATAAPRRPKWHPTPPPPPSPKILNLPRRIRHRKQPKKPTKDPPSTSNSLQKYHSLLDLHQGYCYCNSDRKGKLERLFGEEREFPRSDCSVPIVLLNSSSSSLSLPLSSGGRRERVENEVEEGEEGEIGGGWRGGFVEEKWKFQAEMLIAECNFLRKERELALKKLDKNKVQMQRILRSAVETLISGRKKIFEGKNVNAVLEEEIEDLAGKLEVLQKNYVIKDSEVRKCSNFDKKACHLQRRLEKLGGLSDEKCVNELQELGESSLSMNRTMNHEIDKESCASGPRCQNKSPDVELFRRKMEGLSMEMLDRIEEDFGSILSTTANSSVASSASTSKRIEHLPDSTFSSQLYQESIQQEDSKCSGRCKAIVRKIVEQVRAETEQWSQMQAMLGKVREEMEELQASRNFWEDQALNSDSEIQLLQSSVQEWKAKALDFEMKADELQKELSALRGKHEKLRAAECSEQSTDVINSQNTSLLPLSKRLGKENHTAFYHLKENHQADDKECEGTVKKNVTVEVNSEIMPSTDVQPISLGKQLEMEKRLLMRRLKEKHQANDKSGKQETDCSKKSHTCNSTGLVTLKRSPFRDIGNSSPLMKQSSRTVFPLNS